MGMFKELTFVLGAKDKATKKIDKVTKSIEIMSRHTGKLFKDVFTNSLGAFAGGKSLQGLLNPAMELDKPLRELASLGVEDKVLDGISQEAKNFAAVFGGEAKDVIASCYDIKRAFAGINDADLGKISVNSAILAKGTKADSKAVSSYFSALRQTYAAEAAKVGDVAWIENLSGQTAQAFKMFKNTSVEGFNAVFAALGKQSVSLPEQLAVIGVGLEAGLDASTLGAGYKHILDNIDKMGSKLKISVRGADGELLAMDEILANIRKTHKGIITGKSLASVLGSNEAAKTLYALQKGYKGLGKGIGEIEKINANNPAISMAASMTSGFDRLKSAVANLGASFGDKMLPGLDAIANGFANALNRISELMDRFPRLTKVVGYLTVALLAGATALGIFGAIAGVLKVFSLLTKIIKLTTIAQLAYNTALWLCPITWIIAVILILIGFIAWAIMDWESFVDAVTDTYPWRFLRGTWDWVMYLFDLFAQGVAWLIGCWDEFTMILSDTWWGKAILLFLDAIMGNFLRLIKCAKWILEQIGYINAEAEAMPDLEVIRQQNVELQAERAYPGRDGPYRAVNNPEKQSGAGYYYAQPKELQKVTPALGRQAAPAYPGQNIPYKAANNLEKQSRPGDCLRPGLNNRTSANIPGQALYINQPQQAKDNTRINTVPEELKNTRTATLPVGGLERDISNSISSSRQDNSTTIHEQNVILQGDEARELSEAMLMML